MVMHRQQSSSADGQGTRERQAELGRRQEGELKVWELDRKGQGNSSMLRLPPNMSKSSNHSIDRLLTSLLILVFLEMRIMYTTCFTVSNRNCAILTL